MKKKGFTLAEVLIAVCIIAVISAIMASAFNQAKPDKTKMMYLKAYDALTEAVSIMANDPTLFATERLVNGVSLNIENAPFLDIAQPTNPYYYGNELFQGDKKFAYLLSYILKDEAPRENSNGAVIFRTGPGNMDWTVTPDMPNLTQVTLNDTVGACNKIDLTIDGNRNFSFCVQMNGDIEPLDDIGATYIRNRRNVRSRNDIQQNASSNECAVSYHRINEEEGVLTVGYDPVTTQQHSNIPEPEEQQYELK